MYVAIRARWHGFKLSVKIYGATDMVWLHLNPAAALLSYMQETLSLLLLMTKTQYKDVAVCGLVLNSTHADGIQGVVYCSHWHLATEAGMSCTAASACGKRRTRSNHAHNKATTACITMPEPLGL
jgi:hypothetical protein